MGFDDYAAIITDHELPTPVLMFSVAKNIGIKTFNTMNKSFLLPKFYGPISSWWLGELNYISQLFQYFVSAQRFGACSNNFQHLKSWLCEAFLVTHTELFCLLKDVTWLREITIAHIVTHAFTTACCINLTGLNLSFSRNCAVLSGMCNFRTYHIFQLFINSVRI